MTCDYSRSNVEADARIQLSSIKLETEEACKHIKQCHSTHQYFLFLYFGAHWNCRKFGSILRSKYLRNTALQHSQHGAQPFSSEYGLNSFFPPLRQLVKKGSECGSRVGRKVVLTHGGCRLRHEKVAGESLGKRGDTERRVRKLGMRLSPCSGRIFIVQWEE